MVIFLYKDADNFYNIVHVYLYFHDIIVYCVKIKKCFYMHDGNIL